MQRIYQILAICLFISVVACQREVWLTHPPSNLLTYYSYNFTAGSTITFECPNGVVLLSARTLTEGEAVSVDNTNPNFISCSSSFHDNIDGVIHFQARDLEGRGYNVSTPESQVFNGTDPKLLSAITKIGFLLHSERGFAVVFLGPSCGNGVREYLEHEDCDSPTDPKCLFCGCEFSGGHADYNNFQTNICLDNPSKDNLVEVLLAIILPVVLVPVALVIVLRVLFLKGILKTKKQRENEAMEMDIARQQAAEGALPHAIVKLDP